MQKLMCLECGGDLTFINNGIFQCKYCGTYWKDFETKLNYFNTLTFENSKLFNSNYFSKSKVVNKNSQKLGYNIINNELIYYEDIFEVFYVPNNVCNISYRLFNNCRNLKRIILPPNILRISNNLFENCASLESIELNDKLIEIGDCAFKNCICLTTVFINKSLRVIKNNVFYGCKNLKTLMFNEDSFKWGKIVKLKNWKKNSGNFKVETKNGKILKMFS